MSYCISDYQSKYFELNTVRINGSKEYREKIDNIIDLHKHRKIPDFRTARKVVVVLAFPTAYTRKRSLKIK